MNCLKENLGRRISVKELAEYLGLDTETVRRHYVSLGGIRLGRRILFFENLIVETIKEECHALQEEEKEQNRVGGRSDAPGEEVLQGVRDQIRGPGLGVGNKKKACPRINDPYGLLESD